MESPTSSAPPRPPSGLTLDIGAGSGHGDAAIGGMTEAVVSAFGQLPGGLLAWSYPAAVMTVPGLLVLLAVLAQAGGALAWLPIARRSLGGFGVRRRTRERKEPTPPGA